MREPQTRSIDQKWVHLAEQRVLRKLLTENGLAGASLLDVPCGYGRLWPLFEQLKISVVGVDLELDLVRRATSLHRRNAGHAVNSNSFKLPFADNSFHCVICIRMLHLQYTDRERFLILSELTRVSRSFVIVSVYRTKTLHRLVRFWNSTPGRVRYMTDQELNALTRATGLKQQAARSVFPLVHMQTFLVLRKEP